jgi:hypothetical protein
MDVVIVAGGEIDDRIRAVKVGVRGFTDELVRTILLCFDAEPCPAFNAPEGDEATVSRRDH